MRGVATTMQTFQLALTGDFLNEAGEVAYGDIRLSMLDAAPGISYRFLREQAPSADSEGYWSRLYSLQVNASQIQDIDGLVVLRPWVKRDVFSQGAERLVVIGRSGAGYDKIDLDACTENDVAVFNAPMALNHSTASSALLFMLALAKKLPQQDRLAREGRWDLQPGSMGTEIQGRTLGIIGLGHSGRELVRLVAPFEMRLLAYSPHADPEEARRLGVELTSLERVLSESDFVSLHARLTPANHRMLRAEHLALMKPTAYLVNVARGEMIDQAALVDALRRGCIAGAGLDVFEVEPLPANDSLTGLDNVILSPHWSASTADIWAATGQAMAEGMLRASQGLVPDNVVNREVLDRPGFRSKLARFGRSAAVPPP